MSQDDRFLQKLITGNSDANIDFKDLQKLLVSRGFELRIRGDHFIFVHPKVEEIINLQPLGHLAKPYQVRQVRSILIKYRMAGGL